MIVSGEFSPPAAASDVTRRGFRLVVRGEYRFQRPADVCIVAESQPPRRRGHPGGEVWREA